MDLTIDRLTKQFGSKIAVDRVSTRLTPGVYGLLGANGAGKTTLMRMVCDVLRPTSGEIRFDGRDVHLLGDEYRARLGYLPQDFGYYPDFSALDFMCYLAALKGLDRRAARRRSLELLETVGLADVAGRKIRTFSGGMKQRLGIAQAVLNDPAVLVLDEPTAGLDPEERMRFRTLIATLGADRTVILSTHILDDVAQTCPYVCVLRSGRLCYDGATAGLIDGAHGRTWLTPPLMAPPTGAVVVNAATTAQGTRYRIVSAAPPAGSQPVEPTLEDGYMALASDDRARA